jgi:tetratricopeptide (TPR) repeat protein
MNRRLTSRKLIISILKWFLTFIVLLVAILGLGEGFLRLTGIGASSRFIIGSKDHPGYCEMDPKLMLTNELQEKKTSFDSKEIFRKIKLPGTVRIFVIGDLTYNTWPYNSNSSFHRILTQELQKTYPSTNFEVINLSVSKVPVSFYRNAPQELKKYQADAVLIYSGNNEFTYQNMGGGVFKSLCITKLLYGIINPEKQPAENRVLYGSNTYRSALERYENNLDKLVSAFKAENIPVLLSTVVCKEKDQLPVCSTFSTIHDTAFLDRRLAEGENALRHKDFDKAYVCFSKIARKDNGNALCNYFLGELAYQNKDYDKARNYFKQAVNLDLSKRRAPEDINKMIRKTALLNGCALIDSKKIFEAHSFQGIPDGSLFLEENRPNIRGNMLLAEAFFEKIAESGLVKEQAKASVRHFSGKDLMFSKFDSVYETVSAHILNKRYSVYGPDPIVYDDSDCTPEGKMALSIAKKELNWSDAMNRLYDYYIRNKNYTAAFKVIEGLALANPYNLNIYKQAANTASALGDSQMVVFYARKAFRLQPDFQLAEHLFISYLKLDMPENALPFLKYARDNHTPGIDLSILYAATREVIDLKRLYISNPNDISLLHRIADKYNSMGNTAAALKYAKLPN